MPLFEKVAIIGVGLIGASLARAMKKHSICGSITGCGRGRENLELALRKGYIDSFEHDPSRAVHGADLVVLASSVKTFQAIADSISGSLKPGAIVIDVGSVKGAMVQEIQALMPDGVEFVGCHPIAGSESAGADASRESLFEGAPCLITPTSANTDDVLGRITLLWESIGSRVRTMDVLEHDHLLGLVSHFPHLAAYAIVNTVEDGMQGAIALSGAGLKDTTRIAMSPASLWRDICIMNSENVVSALDLFIRELEEMKGRLEAGDAEGLEKILSRAEQRRRSIEG